MKVIAVLRGIIQAHAVAPVDASLNGQSNARREPAIVLTHRGQARLPAVVQGIDADIRYASTATYAAAHGPDACRLHGGSQKVGASVSVSFTDRALCSAANASPMYTSLRSFAALASLE